MGGRLAQKYVFPLVGMTLFWGYFRYQSFFEALFPPCSTVGIAGATLQSHAVFLLVLALMAVMTAVGERRCGFLGVPLGPAAVAAGSFAGTAGVLVALAAGSDPALPVLIVSSVLVAFGFLTGYLAWAEHFSSGFSSGDMVMLAASFALSLMVCVGLTRSVGEVFKLSLAVATPLGTGLAWCMSERRATCESATLKASLRGVPSFVALFLAFLVFGAVVRGVVDAGTGGLGLGIRWPVSVALALTLLVACAFLWARGRVMGVATRTLGVAGEEPFASGETSRVMAERVCLGSWVVLAALLCLGVVWGLAVGSYGSAGQLAVVARSTLDFVMWVMLCSVASRPGVGVRPVFLAFGMTTQIVSWVLSYAVVPAALESLASALGSSAADALVLCSLMALMVALVVALGTLYLRGRRADLNERGARRAEVSSDVASADNGGGESRVREELDASVASVDVGERVGEYLAQTYGLSPREVQVVLRFSQGNSIKHIASDLGISSGTVQSHVKGAYRKLDVHSRDELKGLLNCLADLALQEPRHNACNGARH